MKDDNKVHATDTIKDLGKDIAHHTKEGAKDVKATMSADYQQTKEDIDNRLNKNKEASIKKDDIDSEE